MKGELPQTPELSEKYRASKNCETPIFHAVSTFDVLNEIFIRSVFHLGQADERTLASDMIDDISKDSHYKDESQIWIFDRGFPSLLLLQKLFECEQRFVMRVSSSILKEVNLFRQSKYVDREVHVKYTKQRMSANHVHAENECEFDLRCVRIRLSSGEDEILITNLDRQEFPKRDIRLLAK